MVATISEHELANNAYNLIARRSEHEVHLRLCDLATGFCFADGPYVYRATCTCDEGMIRSEWLRDATIAIEGEALRIRGRLASLLL